MRFYPVLPPQNAPEAVLVLRRSNKVSTAPGRHTSEPTGLASSKTITPLIPEQNISPTTPEKCPIPNPRRNPLYTFSRVATCEQPQINLRQYARHSRKHPAQSQASGFQSYLAFQRTCSMARCYFCIPAPPPSPSPFLTMMIRHVHRKLPGK